MSHSVIELRRAAPKARHSRWVKVAWLTAAFTSVYVVAVCTPTGQWLDNLSMHAANRPLPWVIARSSRAVLQATVPGALLTLVLVAALARRSGGRGLRQPMLLIVGSMVTAELLKLVILPRPNLLGVEPWLAKPAFPSGHLTLTLSLGTALILVTTSLRGQRLATAATWIAGSVMSATLLVTHNHRLSELVGSCLVVAAASALTGATIGLSFGDGGYHCTSPEASGRIA